MAKTEDVEKQDSIGQALKILADLAAANNTTQKVAIAQNAPKSLSQVPKISPYNWRGEKDHPMPELKCELLTPFSITPELQRSSPQLDREEVELFNLLEPGEYTLKLTDASRIPCNVVGVRNQLTGKLERLSLHGLRDPDTNHYTALFSRDNRHRFPELRVLLRQIVGEKANGVMTMEEELRRTQLAEDHPDRLSVSVGA